MTDDRRAGRRVAAYRMAARAVLGWEMLVRAIWPVLAACCALAALAMSGITAWLPGWLHLVIGLACLAGLAVLLRRAARAVALPGTAAAERRLERDSGLAHRPFAVLRDVPAGGEAASPLWRLHQARARQAIARLSLRRPDAALAAHDPIALRAGAVLLLAASLVVAGPQAGARLAAFFLPGLPDGITGPAPVIQAWIQPPAYTGLAPVFLPEHGGAVTVPTGSRLTISMTGLGGRPHVSVAGGKIGVEKLGQGSYQAAGVLTKAGALSVASRFFNIAGWTIVLIPNEPPSAAWAKLPGRAGTSLATSLPWQVAQRWGVAALEANLRPSGHPDLPALRIPLPLPGTPKQANGAATPDLSANPYAGLTVTGVLDARDVSGQHGQSPPADFVLPARQFHHPLARAIADLRRRLALHPGQTDEAAAELGTLAEAPVAPPVPGLAGSGVTLNLAADAALLSGKPDAAAVSQAQLRLWTLALALDGALPDAALAALDEARENLRRGLEDHAHGKLSDRELADKLQALRQALDHRLSEMARQAMKQGALQHFDPQTQHLSSSAIDHAISKLEQALKEGRMDDARQAMAQLNRMMDQLKNAHIMTQEESRQQQQAQQKGRQQMGAVQDMVQRETGLLDHAQLRAPRPQFRLPPMMMQDPGRPDLFPPQGTEDPDQSPDQTSPDQTFPGQTSHGRTPPPALAQQAPPDASTPKGAPPDQTADARTQRALHRALDALKQGIGQSGHTPPAKLDEAGRAMAEAADALSRSDDPTARDSVGRAIAALQQGAQSMAKDQQGQGGSSGLQLSLQPGGQPGQGTAEGEEGSGDGHLGGKRDPFGRQVDGSGTAAEDPDLRVPDEMERGRSRAIQEELRRRGADRARPKGELDYIDRLLRPF